MTDTQGFLVVSDLHLSEGRNPLNGWIDPREDFLFDEEFADFLEYHTAEEEWSEVEWTLVIAGDFVDFLQVTEMPGDRPDLEREGDYGLTSGPEESAWKIRRIMQGHPVLFRALAKFSRKHRIVIISGNHDAEFFFPEVRDAVASGLLELETPARGEPGPWKQVRFFPWFFFDGNVYVEHGHQYDPVNSFPSALSPLGEPAENSGESAVTGIFLPLGSIFVRYLFNRVETSSPYADNVKPEIRFIGWFIWNHPLRAFLFLATDGRKMLKKIRESCKEAGQAEESPPVYPDPMYSGSNDAFNFHANPGGGTGKSGTSQQQANQEKDWQNPAWKLEGIQVMPLLSRPSSAASRALLSLLGSGWIVAFLLGLMILNVAVVSLFLSPLWSLMLPEAISNSALLREIISWNRQYQVPLIAIITQLTAGGILYFQTVRRRAQQGGPRVLKEKAASIDEILHPEYIVMGHSHEPDLCRFPSGCQYINTGTWTRIFSYESSAAREEKEFIYTRIIDEGGKRRMDLMKWEGRGGAGRRANLIDN